MARQSDQTINYLRNSVKATVDAYDGTVTLYQYGADDPILDAWNKAFGGHLVKPQSEIPPALAAHFRYPEDQFKVQRDLLTRYHVTNPQDFFSGQDFWQVPNDPADDSSGLSQPPYYVLAQFPEQKSPTFQLTAAMTLRTQPNLSALITGYYDANGTPQLNILQTTQVPGPTQVQQKMQNDTNVRSQLSFISTNSRVVYGNLLSLPLDDGILYVEPVYIRSTGPNSYPVMRKVLLSYGDYVAFDNDIASGITDLLKQAAAGPPATTTPPPSTNPSSPPSATPTPPPTQTTPPPATSGPNSAALNAAIQQINTALQNLQQAQKNGNFADWGKALQQLNDATAAYERALNSSSSPAPPGSPTPTPTK